MLLAMRADGLTDHQIQKRTGIKVTTLQRRLDDLAATPVAAEPRDEHRPRSDPLPAGHPLTWGLITAGTSLAGQPYPR